jgi:acyl CoA:acetate/3-ketoacid CoA transferase beta subunit
VSPATGELATRLGIATESKRRVAPRAAQLITPGSTVFLGGGTTAHAVAEALPQNPNAMILTPSPAAVLVRHPTVDVFVLGGRLVKQAATDLKTTAATWPELHVEGQGGTGIVLCKCSEHGWRFEWTWASVISLPADLDQAVATITAVLGLGLGLVTTSADRARAANSREAACRA